MVFLPVQNPSYITILSQIFGKIGNLQTKSWKLKEESGDLPVQLLSNKCQYFSSDLHATRASHIMLLELIVDRCTAFYLKLGGGVRH